eukprot:353043_1
MSLPQLSVQNSLTFGYCRLNYTHNIPIALIKLILVFYNDIFYWKFKDKSLNNFLSTQNGQRIESKTININGILFYCTLHPNGPRTRRRGIVKFGVRIKQMPSSVDYVVFVATLCNFNRAITAISGFKHSNIKPLTSGFSMLTLDSCKDFTEINFCCKIDILRIGSKNGARCYHLSGINMHKHINAKWIFSNKEIEILKHDYMDMTSSKEK